MALTPTEQQAVDRLADYNSNRYDAATNPRGLAGEGYKTEIPRLANDASTAANAVSRIAGDVAAVEVAVTATAASIAGSIASAVTVSPQGAALVAAATPAAARSVIGAVTTADLPTQASIVSTVLPFIHAYSFA